MANLMEHPTVRRFYERAKEQGEGQSGGQSGAKAIEAEWLRRVCLEAGADDVGFVEIGSPGIAGQRDDILTYFPPTKTLIGFVCRMNREPVRSTARSLANLEFHHAGDHVNEVARRIVALLEQRGIRAVNPSMGFPMEMDRFPGKTWVVSHKPVAVAAGLGQMGIHRNVIHPSFGNFILLGTVLLGAEVTEYQQPLAYNPCLECKLCVSACPVGAISSDGEFNFSACYTHNYREFMGGFNDWAGQIAESRDARDYRRRVSDSESASMWQSLSFGANYKAAYCMAVCPAGEDVIAPFLKDRKSYLQDVVKPLQEKKEIIYVVEGSDAEEHVARRFPHKRTKRVDNGFKRSASIRGFLYGLPLAFQRGQAKGLEATYHFTFTGSESVDATISIHEQKLEVDEGHRGQADLRVTADSETWLGYLAQERNLVWALLRRKIRIKGSPRLLLAFGKCFR